MSYVVAALIGGVALTLVMSSDQTKDTATVFMTGAFVGVAVQLTLRATKVS